MKRTIQTPRKDWEQIVASQGVSFARVDGQIYWDESVAYEFTAPEIDQIEAATNELHERCIAAAGTIIEQKWYARLGIPEVAIPLIEKSWNEDEASLYGRFDIAYDGVSSLKMLEYNADTPTSLVEAAVAQWFWLETMFPSRDQFNSIHDRLIAAWQEISKATGADCIHLSALRESLEDNQTILYLEDTVRSAKLKAVRLAIEDIGWDETTFVDWSAAPIEHLFKLYPWEWLVEEEFGAHLAKAQTKIIEPAWKMLLSSKGILPLLWELNPDHPNLLPAYFEGNNVLKSEFVRKYFFSREGANVQICRGGIPVAETDGPYNNQACIYQAIAPLANFDGFHPILGSWVVAGEAAGIGVREDNRLISTNVSRFVPHFF